MENNEEAAPHLRECGKSTEPCIASAPLHMHARKHIQIHRHARYTPPRRQGSAHQQQQTTLLTIQRECCLLVLNLVSSTLVYVFITAVPITKLFAWGEGDSGGHVLRETTSRGLCGLV